MANYVKYLKVTKSY